MHSLFIILQLHVFFRDLRSNAIASLSEGVFANLENIIDL